MPSDRLIDHPHLESDEHGLGWIPAPDPRNEAFPMQRVIALATDAATLQITSRTYRTWQPGARLDQGQTPMCVGYSGESFLLAAPIMDKYGTVPHGDEIYRLCKARDGFPNQEGSTTNALMHVLRDDLHRIQQWVWCWDEAVLRHWVFGMGPALAGTWWYADMMEPDRKGYLHPTGGKVGGHEYLVVGYSSPRGAYRIKNSWGAHWGQNGLAWIAADDLAGLIADDGECAAALEVQLF